MSSMQEDIQCAGSDTRPPMLDRTDFESWQQRIRLYCLGKDNGENIMKSIKEGPFQMEQIQNVITEDPCRGRYNGIITEDHFRENNARGNGVIGNVGGTERGGIIIQETVGYQRRMILWMITRRMIWHSIVDHVFEMMKVMHFDSDVDEETYAVANKGRTGHVLVLSGLSGCSKKHMTGSSSKLMNLWNVLFECDLKSILVEGLGHNHSLLGKLCDSDLWKWPSASIFFVVISFHDMLVVQSFLRSKSWYGHRSPMRVQSIKGKKYTLSIVDELFKILSGKVLRSKDETPAFVINFLKQIQVPPTKPSRWHISSKVVPEKLLNKMELLKTGSNRTLGDAARTM
ncbi:hypothetical protein Tco_0709019 [Tanacetum coccineum]